MKPSLLAALAALALAAPSAAQPNWSEGTRVTVSLSSFKFDPAELRLKAGQPIVLHLQNVGAGGHNFSAPAFFAAAAVRPQDRAKVSGGAVDIPGHGTVDVALVPVAGTYKLKCTHMMHSTFGMTGSIVVG
jgi:plastocyanin